MAKTFEVVVYDDDGTGATCAVTEYDRDDHGKLTYVGREFYDAEETDALVWAIQQPGAVLERREWVGPQG